MIKVNVAERASERRKEKERNSSDGDAMASEAPSGICQARNYAELIIMTSSR